MAEESFDFVVIGGGTAGLTIASRLADDPTQRVLVLEAGIDASDDVRVRTPGLWGALLGSEHDWGFQTKPQPGLNDRTIGVSQGKLLGGSGAINAQLWVPSTRKAVDCWESSLKNTGWNWETLRPYYAKSYTSPPIDETTRKSLAIDSWKDIDTTHGPIKTSFAGDTTHPLRRAWADTFLATGDLMDKDPFLNGSVGSFSNYSSISPDTKERSHAVTAYYNYVKARGNLVVLTGAMVQKVLLQGSKATGVQYQHESNIHIVSATKEIILSAGALQSPRILELSGIGNQEILEKHNIPTLIHLPGVGENLQDHLVCSITFAARDEVETLDSIIRQEPQAVQDAMNQHADHGTGPLSSVGVEAYAYLPVHSHQINPEGREKLMSLLDANRPTPSSSPSPRERREQAYYQAAETNLLDPSQPSAAHLCFLGPQGCVSPPGEKSLSFGVIHSQPVSAGSVHVNSSDSSSSSSSSSSSNHDNHHHHPEINPRYLSNELDLEILAANMLELDRTVRGSPALVGGLLREPVVRREIDGFNFLERRQGGGEGEEEAEEEDLEAAKEWVKRTAVSMWHLGGSCAMLPRDMDGVVDTELRVYGVEGLRVVDASAIPLISTANLQATVYAFAERAADIVKEAWGLPVPRPNL